MAVSLGTFRQYVKRTGTLEISNALYWNERTPCSPLRLFHTLFPLISAPLSFIRFLHAFNARRATDRRPPKPTP